MKVNGATQMMSYNSFLHFGSWHLFRRGQLCRGGFLLVSAVNWHRSKFIQVELDVKKDLLGFILASCVNPLIAAPNSTGLVLHRFLIN